MNRWSWVIGKLRRMRSTILRNEVEVIGVCTCCGVCCTGIHIRDKGRWISSERQFRKLCKREPEHERFAITGTDDSGLLVFSCTLQGEDNMCTTYASRPALCRKYPTKSLYYQGGTIRPDCGYSFKALTFRDWWMRRRRGRMPRFSDVLKKERKRTDTE